MRDAIQAIHNTCDTLGTYAPRVKDLPHAIIVSMRNGDGERVIITMDPSISPQSAAERIRIAYKTKAGVAALTTEEMFKRIQE